MRHWVQLLEMLDHANVKYEHHTKGSEVSIAKRMDGDVDRVVIIDNYESPRWSRWDFDINGALIGVNHFHN